MTRRQALDHYMGIVKDAIDIGVVPRCHFEDITRADFYGFVVPFANALMDLANESGIPIKSAPATPWDMVFPILELLYLAACQASSMACSITLAFPTSSWNGMDTTTFIRVW